MAAWHGALVRTVKPSDLRAVLRSLVEAAKNGEAWAVRELLDRCLGKPQSIQEPKASPGLPPSDAPLADTLEVFIARARARGITPPVGMEGFSGHWDRDSSGE